MSRQSEYDAHQHMRPKKYSQGYLDGQRDRKALTALYIWIACFVSGFAIGLLTKVAA